MTNDRQGLSDNHKDAVKSWVAKVRKVLEQNFRTADIVTEGTERVSTVEMGGLIVAAIETGN